MVSCNQESMPFWQMTPIAACPHDPAGPSHSAPKTDGSNLDCCSLKLSSSNSSSNAQVRYMPKELLVVDGGRIWSPFSWDVVVVKVVDRVRDLCALSLPTYCESLDTSLTLFIAWTKIVGIEESLLGRRSPKCRPLREKWYVPRSPSLLRGPDQ